MLAGTVATARQAAIMVGGSGIKSTVIPEDEELMKACPELAGGSVTYKDEADLEAKISQIGVARPNCTNVSISTCDCQIPIKFAQ